MAGLQHSLWAGAKSNTFIANTEKATEGADSNLSSWCQKYKGDALMSLVLLHSPWIPGVSGDLQRALGVLLHNHRHNPGTSQFLSALWVPAYGCWQMGLHPESHRGKDGVKPWHNHWHFVSILLLTNCCPFLLPDSPLLSCYSWNVYSNYFSGLGTRPLPFTSLQKFML